MKCTVRAVIINALYTLNMKRVLFILFSVLGFLMPVSVYAAVTTDASSYVAPADVLYSGMDGIHGAVLYFNEGTGPVCPNTGSVPSAVPNSNLSDWCSAQPGYTYSSSTVGAYQLLELTVSNCTGSYSACLTANGYSPGSAYEADFTITNSTPTASSSLPFDEVFGSATSTASSTIAIVDIPTLDVFMAWFVFMFTFAFIIWIFRKS